jgi:hypothetical protein
LKLWQVCNLREPPYACVSNSFSNDHPFFSTFFARPPLFHLFLSTRPPFYVGSKAICLKAFFLLHPSVRSYRNKIFFPPLL